jgi:iron-sulfur cluster repair protein YtfE (RIC family)
MKSIRDILSDDHRSCDEIFAQVEQGVAAKQWAKASDEFAGFRTAMLNHFAAEETILFPAFEARTGMTMGPTQVMRSEHVQMRQLLDAASEALTAKDADEYSGNAETLLIMMQQHNMKEENILYPMCDQRLGDQADALVEQMQAKLGRH